MSNRKLLSLLLCFGMFSLGKEWRETFDHNIQIGIVPRQARMSVETMEYTLTQGVKGKALDLRSNVNRRTNICLPDDLIDYDKQFSGSIWVKTDPEANTESTLFSNGGYAEKTWGIRIQGTAAGSWKIELTDGKNLLEYAPPLQKINDGLWHMLAFSLNYKSRLACFYFDSHRTAVYHIGNMKKIKRGSRTYIGGEGEEMMETFNGCLDEVRLTDKILTDKEILAEFTRFQPNRKIPVAPALKGDVVRCLSWNIWHGGRHTGRHIGPHRVAAILRELNPDVIGLIETYGSGAILADELGYDLYLISSNLSILSRYPMEEFLPTDNAFCSGAAKIRFSENRSMIYNAIWLDYRPDVLLQIGRKQATNESLAGGESATRLKQIKIFLQKMKPHMLHSQNIPVVMAGDFNVPSHLDWTAEYQDLHQGLQVQWPVSLLMEKTGFTDTYRSLHPDVRKNEALSWCVWDVKPYGNYFDYPLQARIDFIYLMGGKAISSEYVDQYQYLFPSDHGLFYTDIQLPENH